ncbi:MAG: dTMP kinase [Alphaproteobacteria bacterium]
MTSVFITFEGGEGSGKSTQVKMLSAAFERIGKPCVVTREPGGTPSAELVRKLVVEGSKDAWLPESETLLFVAARMEHVKRLIQPSLMAGKTVICDRFYDSTCVYQGIGKGINELFISKLHSLCFDDFQPHLTFILDIEPEVGLKRAASRNNTETRFESMPDQFHVMVRQGFLDIARENKQRCVVLDASQDKDALHKEILNVINKRFGVTIAA